MLFILLEGTLALLRLFYLTCFVFLDPPGLVCLLPHRPGSPGRASSQLRASTHGVIKPLSVCVCVCLCLWAVNTSL